MLLVAIDTSGRNGSVALCRGGHDSFETLQLSPVEGGAYSARLMPTIADVLAGNSFTKEQIDAFVIVSGPGSFTGLRVGIATVKGLCEVLHKPLAAVSMLEAVAVVRGPQVLQGRELRPDASKGHGFSRAEGVAWDAASGAEVKVTVALDAGRGEVYVGEFELSDWRASVLHEYIAKLDAFAAEASSRGAAVLTPDSKVADALLAARAATQIVDPVRANDIGRLGLTKLLRGEAVDPATLDANYIRRSDAELFSAPKR